MSGTKLGGIRTAATVKSIYGNDYYKRIGSKGGSAPTKRPKGFAANKELARIAGIKGGKISRRKHAVQVN